MKAQKIYCKDVPDDKSIHVHLINTFDLHQYTKKLPIKSIPNDGYLFRYKIAGLNQAKLLTEAQAVVEKNGWWGFASMYKESEQRDSYHGGFSITYNPYRTNVPIYASSLGQTKANVGNLFYSDAGTKLVKVIEERGWTEKFAKVISEQGLAAGKAWLERQMPIDPNLDWTEVSFNEKPAPTRNGYFDTYRFTKKVPEMNNGEFGNLFSKYKVDVCRSRCAWLRPGKKMSKHHDEFLWHSDEPLFTNLRMNIPLKTNPNFFLEDKIHGFKHLEVGYGYSWNTEVLHRVGCYKDEGDERIHLVIGTIPWFDYIPEDDAFVTNEYFGEMHPIDMLVEGHIIEGLELV